MKQRGNGYLRLVVAAPILALAGLMVALYHTYEEALALAKDQLGTQQLLLARQASVGIRKNMELLVRELEWLASQPATIALDLGEYRATAEDTYRYVSDSYVNDVALVDAQGIVLLPLRAPELTGRDFSYREYFQRAREATAGAPSYELITFKGVNAGEKGIVIAMPVLGPDGDFRGVVLFTIIVSELIRGLCEANRVGGTAWVIDREGQVIFHPQYETGTRLPELPDLDPSFRAFLAGSMGGGCGKGEFLSPAGKTIAACHPITVAGQTWSYVVAADERVARGVLARFTVDFGFLTAAGLLVILAAVAVIFHRFRRWHRELEAMVKIRTEDLERSTEKLQELTAELSVVETRERRRIATELHDRIGQALAVARIRLGGVREAVGSTSLGQQLEEASRLIKQTLDETRSLSFELSPPGLHELGLEAALEWMADEMRAQHGLAIDIRSDGHPHPIEGDCRDLLFRSVRELLVNVVKHAGAQRVTVDVRRVDGTMRVTVEDDGVGFDPAIIRSRRGREGGFGLFSIRERLAFCGGQLEIESAPGQGTRATLVSVVPAPTDAIEGQA